jgi:hypothetical protein
VEPRHHAYTHLEPLADYRDPNIGFLGEDRFGSSHAGGLMAALCDGSVRYISYGVELVMWQRLGHRADREVLKLPQ